MFIKGSRYRNIPESSPVNAAGERLRGKDLRLISVPDGRFQHAVREGDRLDLLSFKYYGDATKWWQIADANWAAFPIDFVDRRPVVEERFMLRDLDFETRFRSLVIGLGALGQVSTPFISSFNGTSPADPSFVETTLIVKYVPAPTTHQAVVDAIQNSSVGFRFLRAFAWPDGTDTAEAFSFDDPGVWSRWRAVLAGLSRTGGVFEVVSNASEGSLDVTYNSSTVSRESLVALFALNGFSLEPESAAFPSAGARITIPPNQIV
jgi:hypothetical protein